MLSYCSATYLPWFQALVAMLDLTSDLQSLRNASALFWQGTCQGVRLLELLAQRESSVAQVRGAAKAKWHHWKGHIDVTKRLDGHI
jgi:hypothetical protein